MVNYQHSLQLFRVLNRKVLEMAEGRWPSVLINPGTISFTITRNGWEATGQAYSTPVTFGCNCGFTVKVLHASLRGPPCLRTTYCPRHLLRGSSPTTSAPLATADSHRGHQMPSPRKVGLGVQLVNYRPWTCKVLSSGHEGNQPHLGRAC